MRDNGPYISDPVQLIIQGGGKKNLPALNEVLLYEYEMVNNI